MTRKNYGLKRGIIDPISIFTGLFLVITLVVSAAVVKNKNISLNINEKAAIQKDDCAYGVCGTKCCSAPAPKTNKDTVANAPATKPVTETTKLCGFCRDTATCVSCTNGGENVGECSTNNDCNKGSVNLPPAPTQQPLTTTPIDNKLEQAEVKNIQEVITAPVVINGTVVNPATSVPVEKPAVVEVKSPQTVLQQPIPTSTPIVSTSSTCNNSCPSTQKCVLIGMGYYGCQNTATLTTYEKSDCGGTCSTNQECVHSDGGYVCKTVAYVPYTPQQPSNPCPAGSTYTNGTCITNQQNITNAENQIATLNQTPSTPVVTTSLQDFISSLTDKFNNVTENTGMEGLGTYGLGGGNAYVAPVPQSVVTSTDPNAFSNYNRGSGYSFGAGAITAGAALTGSSLPAIGQSILSNSVVQSILPYYALADIADTTIATVQCGISGNPSSPECSTAVTSLIAPPGYGIADDMSDVINLLPTTNQMTNVYSANFMEQLKASFRPEHNFPTVVANKPDDVILAMDAFNASGGFSNPNLNKPTQGVNSQTVFFSINGQDYVIKTGLENPEFENLGDFQTRSQAGYDAAFLAPNQQGTGITRPNFFTLENGGTASISTKITGPKLTALENGAIGNEVQTSLLQEGRYFKDPRDNVLLDENGLKVIIDFEAIIPFSNEDELFMLLNPHSRKAVAEDPTDFFAQWR